MKRLQTHKSPKRKLKLALVGLIAATGMLVAAPGASAVVTTAPNITDQPNNPNTTQASVSFTFEKGAGEASTAVPFRFYCRQYVTATPPSSTQGWAACGLTSADPPYTKSYVPAANGSQTFEVAGRESTSIATQGPIASYVWEHNIPAATLAPVLTSTPEDPSAAFGNTFAFTGGEGETEIVAAFQCSLDGASFTACNSGTITYKPGNGEHTFQVRGVNPAGTSPMTEFNWQVDVPNPAPHVELSNSTAIISRDTANSWLGKSGVVNAGDINGDGESDVAFSSATTDRAFYVQFSSALVGKGDVSLTNIGPERGYRIPLAGSPGVVVNAGDQNSDGIPDLLVSSLGGFNSIQTAFILYGVADPSTLPLCAVGSATRCLDPATITSEQGYKLVGTDVGKVNQTEMVDFDGDGTLDFVTSTFFSLPGEVTIVRGGERSGPVDIATLPASEKLVINNAGRTPFVNRIADLNGDGHDELAISGDFTGVGGLTALFGFDWTSGTYDLAEFGPDDGWSIGVPPLALSKALNAGDLNGDGRDDLAVSVIGFADQEGGSISYAYLPEPGGSNFIAVGLDMAPGAGYETTNGGLPARTGVYTDAFGDFNNDGLDDLITGARTTPVDGQANVGAAYVIFGQDPAPEDMLLGLGPDLTPQTGVAMLGAASGDLAGDFPVSLGDIDGDGLFDFALSAYAADHNAIGDSGAIYIVLGKSMMAQAKSGNAVGITNTDASLKALVSTNNRDSEAYFEYGTTDGYGETTEVVELEASGSGYPMSAELDGLTKNTSYHYRAVAKNELGLVRYGDDKTFTTTNTSGPGGSDPCLKDPSLPGCAGYCQTNPTALGCPDYPFCELNPGKCSDKGSKAKLAQLVASPKTIRVKRGRKGSVSTIVTNAGGKVANGVKVCVKAPKKFIKVKRCLKVGKLGAGKTRVKTFKVTVRKKARKGKKLNLNFKASGGNVSAKTAKAKVVVVR